MIIDHEFFSLVSILENRPYEKYWKFNKENWECLANISENI